MLTEKQLIEIREHLEKAQNPLFYYDNDADGLCSFLLLRRYIGRGKGVAVKSYPDLNAYYAKKAQELGADYVFVLDKPLLTEEFVSEIDKLQLPLVWIDHHDVKGSEVALEKQIEKESAVYIYNPTKNKGKDRSSEPVTYLSYKVTQRKEDLWIAVMGCVADHYLPDFISDFKKQYPDLLNKKETTKDPFDIYYGTEIGRIAQSLSFGLKDTITHVVQLQNFLIGCSSPSSVFEETDYNHNFRMRYGEIRKKYDAILERTDNCFFGNLLFFDYSGDLSISAEIANELSYRHPGKHIAVAYIKEGTSNVSLRGKSIKKYLEKVLKHFDSATGGGHEDAAGARVPSKDLAKFREMLANEINNNEIGNN